MVLSRGGEHECLQNFLAMCQDQGILMRRLIDKGVARLRIVDEEHTVFIDP